MHKKIMVRVVIHLLPVILVGYALILTQKIIAHTWLVPKMGIYISARVHTMSNT